ncbi:hypothetical protein AMATHDRAFT_52938 [Amanita thiersii Skay4041]|uniref:Uncharacterized protein n=1 Tax=Amanita thiersii Skay4041 TaxID=703135 RepID=A0A2A9NZS7_9AGAR|nr:hypothetical protein AMATHDRAFT_52938 [Amanita thiersii Skay4041]
MPMRLLTRETICGASDCQPCKNRSTSLIPGATGCWAVNLIGNHKNLIITECDSGWLDAEAPLQYSTRNMGLFNR